MESARLTRWMRAVGADGNHAGRNAFEDRFGKAAARGPARGCWIRAPAVIWLKPRTRSGELVHGAHIDAMGEVALAHLAGGIQQRGDRAR